MSHTRPSTSGVKQASMLASTACCSTLEICRLFRGVRLNDGREVVVKARKYVARIAGCVAVQRHLFQAGFPCPEPLAGPTRIGQCALTAERFVSGGVQFEDAARAPMLFARLLGDLVVLSPAPNAVAVLDPAPPWLGWDHSGRNLWPPADDLIEELNAHAGPDWLDDAAAAAREVLAAYDDVSVIGHGDWESQNIRWNHDTPHVVYDWDSVVARPEATLAGAASAVFTATGDNGAPTVEQSEAFLVAYRAARSLPWSHDDRRAAWAAGLWVRAFNAKKRIVRGADPDADLTRREAEQRIARLGGG